MMGGLPDPDSDQVITQDNGKTFFYQKWYHDEQARFEDIPLEAQAEADTGLKYCPACARLKKKELVRTSLVRGHSNSCLGNNLVHEGTTAIPKTLEAQQGKFENSNGVKTMRLLSFENLQL